MMHQETVDARKVADAMQPLLQLVSSDRIDEPRTLAGVRACEHTWRDHLISDFTQATSMLERSLQTNRGKIPYSLEVRLQRTHDRTASFARIFNERTEASKGQAYLALELPFMIADIQALVHSSVVEDPPKRWWQFWRSN